MSKTPLVVVKTLLFVLFFDFYVSFRERNRKIRNRKVRAKNKLLKIEQYSAFQEDIYKKFGIHFQVNVNSFRIDYKALYLYQHLHDYAPQSIICHRHIRYWEVFFLYLMLIYKVCFFKFCFCLCFSYFFLFTSTTKSKSKSKSVQYYSL